MAITQQWAGRVFGTNVGNVFCQFDGKDGQLRATLRVMDEHLGLAVFVGEGTFDGSNLVLSLSREDAGATGGTFDVVSLRGALVETGAISGNWFSKAGAGGTFVLHPHNLSSLTLPSETQDEVLHTVPIDLGTVRLYEREFRQLIAAIRNDFPTAPIYVRFGLRRAQRTLELSQFLSQADSLGRLSSLRILVQQKETSNIHRLVDISLDATDGNRLVVQGAQETWVRGEADHLSAILEGARSWTATSIKKHGLNLNGIIFLCGIAALPELTLGRRFIFLAMLLVIMVMIFVLHKILVPNTIILLNEKRPSVWEKYSIQLISAGIAAVGGTIGVAAFGVLSGNVGAFLSWLSMFLKAV